MRVGWTKKQGVIIQVKPRSGEGAYQMAQRIMRDWRENFYKINQYNRKQPLYQHRSISFPFRVLNDQIQGTALRALFPKDQAKNHSWHHRVTYSWETMSWISAVFIKNKISVQKLVKHNQLKAGGRLLKIGDVIQIPWDWVRVGLQLNSLSVKKPLNSLSVKKPLYVKQDNSGKRFAFYRMQKGEAIYSSVIVRFTGRIFHEEVDRMTNELLALNHIKDARKIQRNREIKIPLAWITEEFLLETTGNATTDSHLQIVEETIPTKSKLVEEIRSEPQITRQEDLEKSQNFKIPKIAKKPKSIAKKSALQQQVASLNEIHIILDAGHGGIDPGAVAGSKQKKIRSMKMM